MSDQEAEQPLRREMDRRLIDVIGNSVAVKEDLMNLRFEVKEMRAELKREITDVAQEHQEKFEAIHQEQIKTARERARLQLYVLFIAFILMQAAVQFFNKLFA